MLMSPNMIRGFDITDEMVSRAKVRLKTMPKLKDSIMEDTATLHGFVGEEMVAEYLDAEIIGNYNYDLLKNGTKLEVKTKRTTVVPLASYDASIARFNTKQRCHYYVFTRVRYDLTEGWIMGMMQKDAYLLKARMLRKGEVDGDNGFIVRADCWNRRYDELMDCNKDLFIEVDNEYIEGHG